MPSRIIRTTLIERSTVTDQEVRYAVERMSYRCFLQCLSWLINPTVAFADSVQESTFFAHLECMYEDGLLTEVHTDYFKNLFVLAGYLNSLQTE